VEGARSDAAATGFGFWLLNAGQQAASSVSRYGDEGATWVRIEAPPAGRVVDLRTATGTSGEVRMGVSLGQVPAGTYTGLLFAATSGGTLAGWFNISAAAGSTILGSTHGASTFLRGLADFDGGTQLVAQAGPFPMSSVAGASTQVTVQDRLFGAFRDEESSTIRYDAPDGSHAGSTDYRLDGSPAGAYVFRVVERTGHPQGLVLLGADARLP
jgi:hypothetical protein